MPADLHEQDDSRTASPQPCRTKLIECPFEVHIDGVSRDQFYDVRDATAAARTAKCLSEGKLSRMSLL
jgi:hypothetical protein